MGYQENSPSKVACPIKTGHRPVPLKSLQLAGAAPTNQAVPVRSVCIVCQSIFNPGSDTGSSALYQLSYGMGLWAGLCDCDVLRHKHQWKNYALIVLHPESVI